MLDNSGIKNRVSEKIYYEFGCFIEMETAENIRYCHQIGESVIEVIW